MKDEEKREKKGKEGNASPMQVRTTSSGAQEGGSTVGIVIAAGAALERVDRGEGKGK